jgi:ParB family chromosome partitioning protein
VSEAATDATSPRGSRVRARPILGSPDLISDPNTSPVGAIGQSLGEFSERAKRAEEIERKLTQGQTIVELDAGLIDPSFVADRMPAEPDALASLTEKIRDHGQLNPILVRPSPNGGGRFQVAFGHRRLSVAKALGRPIKAVVRDLTDEELVIAQGQENHERQDLSYIEKSLFALRLDQRGFSRSTIMAAMSIYKSDLSNMLSVATKVPQDIVSAIGPAPATGRRGWIELVGLLSNDEALSAVKKTMGDASFGELDSDARFKRVLSSAKPQLVPDRVENWSSASGKPLGKVAQNSERVLLTIDRRKAPEFADFVLSRLQDLYLEFETRSTRQSR